MSLIPLYLYVDKPKAGRCKVLERGITMQDLSLHVLDIVENSLRAKSSKVMIEIIEDVAGNELKLKINDNGRGMSKEMTKRVLNPFTTTRQTRRVGLGLSLLYQNCLYAGGDLTVQSKKDIGTSIEAVMQYDHIDRLPIGDMASTLTALIGANPKLHLIYKHIYKDSQFILDTEEVKAALEEIPINNPEIIQWLRGYIRKQIENLYRE